MATGLVLGAVLGFGIGLRFHGASPGASSPRPIASAVDVLPDAVSQRLRDAYYGGGGSIAICLAAESVVCSRAIPSQTALGYTDITRSTDKTEMAALTPTRVPAGQIIVAGDFGPVDGAAIARIGTNGPTDGRLLVVTNPGRQGIDYIDLGSIASGTYLMAIGVPSWRGSPTALIEIVVR